MTLIAGIKCLDGYIVASDTALSVGASVYQGHKIDHYAEKGSQAFRIIVAGSGFISYAKMTSQKLRDKIVALGNRSFLHMKRALEDVVRDIHVSHIGAVYWQYGNSPEAPSFSLIVALEAHDGWGLFRTDGAAVYEVDQCTYSGMGEELAGFLSERLLIHRPTMAVYFSTSAAIPIVKNIFLAAKKSAREVGGNTEIFARLLPNRAGLFDDRLFPVMVDQKLDATYLWGIEEQLAHALRMSLNPLASEASIKTQLAKIEDTLLKIRSAAETERAREGYVARMMHLVELDDGEWSANFSDHQDTGAAPNSAPSPQLE